jgi:hypothetical protein
MSTTTAQQAFNLASAPIGYGFMGTAPYASGTPYRFVPPTDLFAPHSAWPCAGTPPFTDDRYISASADATDMQHKPTYLRVLQGGCGGGMLTTATATTATTSSAMTPSNTVTTATRPSALATVGGGGTPTAGVTYTPLNTQLTGDDLYKYCTQASGPCGNRPDSGSNNPCTDYGTCATECYKNQRVPTCGGGSGSGSGGSGSGGSNYPRPPTVPTTPTVPATPTTPPTAGVTYTPLNTQLTGDDLYKYCTQASGPCGSRPDSGSDNPCTDYGTCATECYKNQRVPTCGGSGSGGSGSGGSGSGGSGGGGSGGGGSTAQPASYSNVSWRAGTTAGQKTSICTAACQLLGTGAGDYAGCNGPSCYAKCTAAVGAQIPTNCANPAYQQYLAGVEAGGGGGSSKSGGSGGGGSSTTYPAATAAALIAAIDPSS